MDLIRATFLAIVGGLLLDGLSFIQNLPETVQYLLVHFGTLEERNVANTGSV
ncbi:hypothetical protein [Thiohalorhabdus sp.]|uniref:hypothetical protein n=1 Tax=Thiohalorhabdus sp. TaxID=3094134 RepID=UPI002FC2F40C